MANTEHNILLALSYHNYIACSTQPKSGLLASCQGQRVYLGKPFNLHKHAWERSSPWENSQHQATNLKVCGWSFASARHRSTLPRAKVVFRLSVSLASENRFWGRWGKAGYCYEKLAATDWARSKYFFFHFFIVLVIILFIIFFHLCFHSFFFNHFIFHFFNHFLSFFYHFIFHFFLIFLIFF